MVTNIQIDFNSIVDTSEQTNPFGEVSFEVLFTYQGEEMRALIVKSDLSHEWGVYDLLIELEGYGGNGKSGWEFLSNLGETHEDLDQIEEWLLQHPVVKKMIVSL